MAVKSSFKNMTLCLLAICLVCSALLAGVYALTAEPIAAAAAAKNEAAIKEVLPETAVAIEEERTVEMDGQAYSYNLAYDEQGNTVGCAINVSALGFGGPIVIKVGFNAEGLIWTPKVLSTLPRSLSRSRRTAEMWMQSQLLQSLHVLMQTDLLSQ